MVVFSIIALLSSFIALIVGTYALAKEPKNQMNILFFILCIFQLYWGITEYHMLKASVFYAPSLIKSQAIWPFQEAVFFHFILVFTQKQKLLKKALTYILIYLPALILTLLYLFLDLHNFIKLEQFQDIIYPIEKISFTFILSRIWLLSLHLTIFITMLFYYFQLTNTIKKKQVRIVLTGLIVAAIIFYVPEIMVRGYDIYQPGAATLSMITIYIFIGYAILRYNLFYITPEIASESILQAMQDTLILCSADGKIINANPSATLLTGYTIKELIGLNLSFIIKQNNGETLIDKIPEIESSRHDFLFNSESEKQLRTKMGSMVDVSVSQTEIKDNENRTAGIVLILRDISSKKNAMQRIQKAIVRTQKSNKLKSTFLANMSHEIRTPINSMIGFVELMLRMPGNDVELEEYLTLVKDNSKLLLALINKILDLSKIEANQIVIEKEKVSLILVLYNVHSHAKTLLEMKGNDIVLKKHPLPANIDENIICDRVRLEQILISLLDNAIKFTESGYVEYGVELQNEQNILFYVHDSGIGIDKSSGENIFNAFEQANLVVTKKYGGVGLGLTLAKKIVEFMNGKIWYESNDRKGTSFYFTLPYIKAGSQKSKIA